LAAELIDGSASLSALYESLSGLAAPERLIEAETRAASNAAQPERSLVPDGSSAAARLALEDAEQPVSRCFAG
jgi:hypothetical protein